MAFTKLVIAVAVARVAAGRGAARSGTIQYCAGFDGRGGWAVGASRDAADRWTSSVVVRSCACEPGVAMIATRTVIANARSSLIPSQNYTTITANLLTANRFRRIDSCADGASAPIAIVILRVSSARAE